jgi:hypothetical protein
MKYNRNNILTEEAQPSTPFFNKQGAQKSSVNDGAQNPQTIQRKCAECAAEENEQEPPVQKKEGLSIQKMEGGNSAAPPAPPVTNPVQTTTPANSPGAAQFITDDNATPEAGQMRKTAFMTRLKAEVCETVNQAMAGTPFTSDNCPYIQTLFAIHENSSPSRIEALIFRYCPAAIQAQSADELIQHIKSKAFTVSRQWAENGGNAGAAAQIFNGVASGVGSIAGSIATGVGNAVSAVSSLFFKENTGGATNTQSPQAVMQSLGKGSSIESGTKSKMEGAFGESFSNVEVHTDSNAAQLSKDMNARAFTVGNHIAFAGGEHQPGTIEGDALMAHELAHTIQQQGGETTSAQMKGSAYNALEEDADGTAMEVMTKMTGREDIQLKNKVKKGLKTGLTVSRCDCNGEKKEEKEPDVEIPKEEKPTEPVKPTPTIPKVPPAPVCKNQKAVDALIKANPRGYDLTKVTMYPVLITKDLLLEDIAHDTKADNNVFVFGHYITEIKELNKTLKTGTIGNCAIALRGWTDPQIGKLSPTAPTATTLTAEMKRAIAVVYAEQTGTSANKQAQQKYIWYSMRKRLELGMHGSTIDDVINKGGYNGKGTPDYKNALTDLGKPTPTIAGVIAARDIVINNWTNALPTNVGPFYFHWRPGSTPEKCFGTPPDPNAQEIICASRFAVTKFGVPPNALGWDHKLPGDSTPPQSRIGSMYIYQYQ